MFRKNVRYRFGKFLLDPARRQLDHIDAGPVALPARAFDVLVRLVSESGKPVSRRELLDLVWQGRVVDENNLAKAIASLRVALGDEHIVTVPRQGYQFVTPVQVSAPELCADRPESPTRARSRSAAPLLNLVVASVATVAVLVAAWFVLRLPAGAESSPEKTVIDSAATADDYFAQGQELLVDYLDPLAVELAVREFSLALNLDPRHLPAQLAIADAYRGLTALSKDKAEALRYEELATFEYAAATELARDASTQYEISVKQLMIDQDWAGADAILSVWLDNEPDAHLALYLYGTLLHYTGHTKDAASVLERALALQPSHLPTVDALSLVHNSLGNVERVESLYEHGRLQPGFTIINTAPMFWTLLGDGRTQQARASYSDVVSVFIGSGEFLAATANRQPPPGLELFDRMLFNSVLNLDRPAAGIAALNEIAADPEFDSTPELLYFAMFASYFGAPELSLEAFARVSYLENEVLGYIWTRHMAPVREHPEFASLLRRFDLDDYWDATEWPEFCKRVDQDQIRCY